MGGEDNTGGGVKSVIGEEEDGISCEVVTVSAGVGTTDASSGGALNISVAHATNEGWDGSGSTFCSTVAAVDVFSVETPVEVAVVAGSTTGGDVAAEPNICDAESAVVDG